MLSYVRICDNPDDIHAVRIAVGEADAVIGGDMIVTASPDSLTCMRAGRTRVAVNCAATPTAEFTHNPDWQFPLAKMQSAIGDAVGPGAAHFIDASELARCLMGDSIAGNLFLLGYAWQLGLIPVSEAALDRAIELNGTAVTMNRAAFLWGRRAADDPEAVARFAKPQAAVSPTPSLEEAMARRMAFLTDYQDAAYAARYQQRVERVRTVEAKLGSMRLTETVTRNLFRLMAIKDEFEVARLYAETDFLQRVDAGFEGDYRIRFHLAPPGLARPDPTTGLIRKMEFGPWLLTAYRWLAKMRGLRGSRWDIFGRTAERRLERQLIADYETDLDALLPRLTTETLADAIALAALPEKIRGYGHVKQRSVDAAIVERNALRNRLGIQRPAA